MPITEERVEKLREFGFSEYAARAYLALLDLGISEARDISTLSKVPQSKIYHVLEQLHGNGLVNILPEFPKKYAPIPFQEYLDRLHEEHMDAAKSIERDREALSNLFSVVGNVEVGDRGDFSVVRGRRNVVDRIRELITNATADILVLGTQGISKRYTHFLAELEGAKKRGASLRFLVPVNEHNLESMQSLAGLSEVRERNIESTAPGANVAMLLVDSARAFIITFVPDDESLYAGKDVGFYTDQESMVAAVQAILEPLWSRAASYDQRRTELREGRKPEFSRFYTNQQEFYEALREATAEATREIRVINTIPAQRLTEGGHALYRHLASAAGRVRLLLNFPAPEAVAEFEALSAAVENVGVRHVDSSAFTRFVVVDDREVFFSVARPGGVSAWSEGSKPSEVPDLVIHTNHPGTVATLRTQFEELWTEAFPLADRRRELEVFPMVQPRKLGIGRLFEHIEDAVIVADAEGRVVLWNAAASRIFGYDVEEALHLNVSALVPERLRQQYQEDMKRFRETRQDRYGGRDSTWGLPATRKDGEEIEVEMTLNLLERENKDGPLILSIVRDVTDRKRTEERLQKLTRQQDLILSNVADGIYGLDAEGRTTFVNAAAVEILGWQKEDLIGQVMHDVIHHTRSDGTSYPAEECPINHTFREGETHRVSNDVFWTKDKRPIPVDFVGTPLIDEDGTVMGAVVTFRVMPPPDASPVRLKPKETRKRAP